MNSIKGKHPCVHFTHDTELYLVTEARRGYMDRQREPLTDTVGKQTMITEVDKLGETTRSSEVSEAGAV
jgi:hypothetical protein